MCNVCGCGSGQTLIGGHALKQARKPAEQVQYRVPTHSHDHEHHHEHRDHVHGGQGHSPLPNPDETTSHSTKPASGQVAGYLSCTGEGARCVVALHGIASSKLKCQAVNVY